MRIVITNHEFRAHFPARILYFYNYLRGKGHELHILELFGKSVCYEFSKNENTLADWEILFPDKKNGTVSTKCIEQTLVKRLDELHPDVIISGMANFPVGIVALRWAKNNNRGIVQFGNALKHTFKRNWLIHQVKRMLFRNVDAYFCPAPAWNDSMIFWGFKENEIFYGLNVANNKEWQGKTENIHFKDLPSTYFLTCGRQVKMKNLSRLLNCYFSYRQRGGKIHLVMVGDGVCHKELLEMVGSTKGITFLPFLSHDRMREIFVQTRALFLPSFKEETWGIVANEAMASGVIVAASTECGCSTTIIKPDENGFLYHPLDNEAIIETMFSIEKLSDEKLGQMQKKAQEVIADWNVERFAQGALEACLHAYSHQKKVTRLQDKLLIKYWQGRMNTKNE